MGFQVYVRSTQGEELNMSTLESTFKLVILVDEVRSSFGDGSEVDILGYIPLPLCFNVLLHDLMNFDQLPEE